MPKKRAGELEPLVREHILDCWLEGRPLSLRSLAKAIGEQRTKQSESGIEEWCSTALKNYWSSLRERGIVTTDHRVQGRVYTAISWSGQALSTCSLATIVAPYLADPNVSAEDKGRLKEGLRKVLPPMTGVVLEGTRTDEMVVVAASRVAPMFIPTIPELLRAAHGKGDEYYRTMRNCMRHAMRAGHAVVMLPTEERDDTWTTWIDEQVPLAERGYTDAVTERMRRALRVLREELEAMTPDERGAAMPATPDDCPAELATRALERVLTARADHRNFPIHRRELLRLGERGLGPYRHDARIGTELVVLADGRHPSPSYFLHSENPVHNAATWEGLLQTMRERRIAHESIAFVEWVRDFSTLPDRELAKRLVNGRKEFPTRHRGLLVELGAETARIRAFRALFGAAVNLHGLDPSACVPPRVFGTDFEVLTDAVLEHWAQRVDANEKRVALGVPPLGSAKHAASMGPYGLIATAGVIALIAYECSCHHRSARGVSVRMGKDGKVLGVDWGAMRTSQKSEAEDAYSRAYDHSRTKASALHDDRGGALATTHKNKTLVYADTPLADLMPAALDELRRRVESKKPDASLAFDASEVLAAGIVASGAARIEELAHMRIDRHLRAAHRADMGIYLEPWDRKGDYTAHEIPLLEALTPRWLLDFVLDVAREELLTKWTAKGLLPHAFVFMDRNGRPFGDPNESADGKQRDRKLIHTRKSKLIAMVKDFRLRRLKEAKLPILNVHGNHGSHAERGRIANLGANLAGVGAERTGRLLGHLTKGPGQRTSTVERSYSRTNLQANRATLHNILLSRPWYLRRYGTASPTEMAASTDPTPSLVPSVAQGDGDGYPSFAAERRAIMAEAKEFALPHNQVAALLGEAMMRWGVAEVA